MTERRGLQENDGVLEEQLVTALRFHFPVTIEWRPDYDHNTSRRPYRTTICKNCLCLGLEGRTDITVVPYFSRKVTPQPADAAAPCVGLVEIIPGDWQEPFRTQLIKIREEAQCSQTNARTTLK